MAIVDEKGTIRNIIRGIENEELHKCLFEIIDDRQHSKSKNVFLDFNTREQSILAGFENKATEAQIDNMVRWNICQEIHTEGGMATASVGLKYWEYLARGKQYHGSYELDTTGTMKYYESSAETDEIFEAARDSTISESMFSEVLKKKTRLVQGKEADEVGSCYKEIYENKDLKYPFNPKTIIWSKKISNTRLLNDLKQDHFVVQLRKELITKYFHEIAGGELNLYLKFHKDSQFNLLEATNNADPVGMTIGENLYLMNIWELQEDFNTKPVEVKKNKKTPAPAFTKGDFLLEISKKFFFIKSNGNAWDRAMIPQEIIDKMNLKHLFIFNQYTIPTKLVESIEENMQGKAMEPYCGIYLKIGGSINNSKPLPTQNLRTKALGARLYRGILEIVSKNSDYIKNKLSLNGLKAKFNLSDMRDLEAIILQAVMLHKKWAKCQEKDKHTHPEKYVCGKLQNEKTAEVENKAQHIYIIKVGDNFYKLGKHSVSNSERINEYLDKETITSTRKDFPNEVIYETPDLVFRTIRPVKNAGSLEQSIKEFWFSLDVDTYNNKQGDDIREYFHCENVEILEKIRDYIRQEAKY
jgi:hypothetical protein